MTLRPACQTITWGDPQTDRLGEILHAVAKSGYQGVEIGHRRFANVPPAELKQMLAETGLTLVAGHIGGDLEQPDQAAVERTILDRVIADLAALDVETLMYSGLRWESASQFAGDFARLCRAADTCRGHGIRSAPSG